ncbi:hypothetical protein L2E82_13145 [Cichorium intybus]|uniref:Uncharacterized protein n=1 Tax=Cichorium intybus TaxID=13427 RepID=A0ACB9GHU3_CICIN|nr:hypothetical protein L2E82_13145 [Cichorium intybus]
MLFPVVRSPRVSKPEYYRYNMDSLFESFLAVSDSASVDAFDRLIESKSTDSDQNDLIQRALHLGSVLLEAGKRSVRKRSSVHNASVWLLHSDLTIKVFSMLDTRSICYTPTTATMWYLVSTMIQRAGNKLQSIKLGLLPPCPVAPSSILTRPCLSSILSANGGAHGSLLRRLHLYNIERMDDMALLESLSVCPSLVDIEIVGLHVELRQTLESVSKQCPLLERFLFESSKKGRGDDLKYGICYEFGVKCPKVTTLALKGCNLDDYKVGMLVKGLRELKYVDFSASYFLTGSFLEYLGTYGGGNNLEVVILRDSMHLKPDISDKQGLASDWFIPIEQLLEQRPNFRLVAEFMDGSYVEYEQMSLNFMRTPSGSYNSDPGSGSEGDNFVTHDESSDDVIFLPE